MAKQATVQDLSVLNKPLNQVKAPRRPANDAPAPAAARKAHAYTEATVDSRGRRRKYVVNHGMLWSSVALVAAVAVGGYFWHEFQSNRNAAHLLQQADQQEQAEHWIEAVRSLRQLTRLAPDDGSVRIRLAKAFDHLAETPAAKRQALAQYAIAAGTMPADKAIRSRHLELLLEVGDPDSALARAEELLKISPGDAGALRAKAIAIHERHRIKAERSVERVREALVAANRADPSDAAVATRLARFYRRELNQPDEAERGKLADNVMDALVESSTVKADALVARHLYRAEFGLPGGADDLNQAVAADTEGKNPAVAVAAGHLAMRDQRWTSAQEHLRRAVGLRPERAEAYLLLGQVRQAQGDDTGALETWQNGLKACGGDDLSLQAQIAGLQIKHGQTADAADTLEQMEKQISWLFGAEQAAWSSVAYALRADEAVAARQYSAAIPLFKRILSLRQAEAVSETKAAADARVHSQLAECYRQLRLWDQCAAEYQSAADLQPRSAELRLAAGRQWELAGWLDEAVRQYEQAATLAPDQLAVWQSLADVLLRQQLQLPTNRRDWRRFDEALAAGRQLEPDAPLTRLLAAEGMIARDRPDQAAALLDALEPAVVDVPNLVGRLVFNYERLGASNKADALLAKLESQLATVSGLVLLKTRLLVRRHRETEAIEALSAAIPRVADDERGALRYQLALLLVARSGLDPASAERARVEFARMSAERPDDPRPTQLLVELDLQSGNLAGARQGIDRLRGLEHSREDSGWRYYLAQVLIAEALRTEDPEVRKPILEQARELERELEAERSRWAPTYLLKARLAQLALKPDDDLAIQAYAQSLRLGERRSAVYQELISLLFRQNRLAEADVYMDHLRQSHDLPPSMVSLAVAADLWEGNLPRAIETARRDIESRPRDPLAHLRLGQLLALSSRGETVTPEGSEEAETELKQARDLAPDDPRGWSALLAFYRHAGRLDEAQRLLTDVERRPALLDADRPFFLAQGYALLGHEETATSHYQRAVEVAANRPVVLIRAAQFFWRREPDRAERYLRRAIDSEPEQTTAKRLLAMFLAERGYAQRDLDEAWQLIEHDASSGEWDVTDRRFKAVLHLQQGGGESREQARQMLEAIVGEAAQATTTDHLLLARLYEAKNQLDKARGQLESLVNRERPDPAYLAMYADYLLRTDRGQADALDRVGQLLEQLVKLQPESASFRSFELRARWLKQLQRGSEIRDWGDKLLSQAENDAPDTVRADLLIRVAGVYASLDLKDEAEACYRRAAEIVPARYSEWAVWLAGDGRADEAVNLCLERSHDDRSSRSAIAAAAALMAARNSPSNRDQAEELIEKSLSRYANDRELLFTAAAMRSMSGNDASAIELLRLCLKLAPHDAATLNNLAILLCETPSGGEEAVSCIDRAIETVGKQPELLDTKGWVLLRQHHPDLAEPMFVDALFRSPGEPKFRFHLALSLEGQGKTAAAHEAFSQSQRDGLAAEVLCPAERAEMTRLASRTP